jgi:undecaprenyl diphosphate synthase
VSPPRSKSPLPKHVGIIMDGNGRWAEERNRQRAEGHLEGVKAAKRIVKAASEMGLEFLSLYVFSTENWMRAEAEVSYLMFLIRQYLKKEYDFYRANGIRIVHSGDVSRLPEDIRRDLESVIQDTAAFKGLTLNLAINYGGKDEILRAATKLNEKARSGDITEEAFRACLDHPEMPDPDLIIRSGGDIRLSNFLLWESAYAELYFSPKLWPDWDAADLEAAVSEFGRRARRFGGA